VRSGSDSKGNVMFSLSRNFASLAEASGEIPSTVTPTVWKSGRFSVKSQASLVQPGVMAAG